MEIGLKLLTSDLSPPLDKGLTVACFQAVGYMEVFNNQVDNMQEIFRHK